MVWKVSRWSGQFPDGLDSFQIAWTVSRLPGMFPGSVICLQVACKVSRWPGNFLCFTKTFQVYKNFPGCIATLLPWFFPLWHSVHTLVHSGTKWSRSGTQWYTLYIVVHSGTKWSHSGTQWEEWGWQIRDLAAAQRHLGGILHYGFSYHFSGNGTFFFKSILLLQFSSKIVETFFTW